jgi:transcriptional regulator with XRE-family HTH domain
MGSEAAPRQWLVELRGERTQKEMADLLGISRAYYSQLELGIRGASVETAQKLAPRMGIPWTRFFEDSRSAVQ